MSNLITKTTEFAMFISLSYVREGDVVIDATCGNGNDTDTATLAKAAIGYAVYDHATDDSVDKAMYIDKKHIKKQSVKK